MDERWATIAERAIDALAVQPGELIQVRDHAGRYDVLQEMLVAIERRGGTPLPALLPPEYLERLLGVCDPAILTVWDRHRRALMGMHDRALVLGGTEANLAAISPAALGAWTGAIHRLNLAEERRQVPYLLVSIPTVVRATALGMSLGDLEDVVLPSLAASPNQLKVIVESVLMAGRNGRFLTIRSGPSCELHFSLGDRPWFSDWGRVPVQDSLPPGVQAVQNLPAGSIYTTVLEDETQGSVWLPRASNGHDVILRFQDGRIVAVEDGESADRLIALFDRHSGEPRRISHVGIGLNPHLTRLVDWPLVDEHRQGCFFMALGENRYLGGKNESSLNIDFVLPNASLLIDRRLVVDEGRLLV